MATIAYYTEEGLQKLKDELHQLRTVERKLIIKAIADARDKGDLSENAEYDAAKSDQGLLEIKIAKMEEIVANARIVDTSKLDITKVSILTTVKIKNLKNNMEMKYTLVAENEADLKAAKIFLPFLEKRNGTNIPAWTKCKPSLMFILGKCNRFKML